MKTAILTVAGLMLAVFPALAQVAAPTLVPAVPSVFGTGSVSANPAAMQWRESSQFVVGAVRSKSVDTALPGLSQQTTTLDGYHLGVLLVGSAMSFGVDYASLDGEVDDGVTTQEGRSNALALAIPVGSSASLGAVRRVVGFKLDTFFGLPATFDVERVETSFGGTVRLGDWFYLGASVGNEDANLVTTFGGASTEINLKRPVRQFGIGIRTDGPTRWHLEYSAAQRESAEDSGSGANIQGEDESTVALELLVNEGWLFGVAATSGHSEGPGGVSPSDRDVQIVVLGYTPSPGWGLFLVRSASKSNSLTAEIEDTSESLTLSYKF